MAGVAADITYANWRLLYTISDPLTIHKYSIWVYCRFNGITEQLIKMALAEIANS